MNKIILLSALILGLASCASPGFLNQPMQRVEVAGSVFKVYMRSGTHRVEAHRVSFEPLPNKVLVLSKAARAIEIATGCPIEKQSFTGDQAIVKAKVECRLP